MSCLMIKNQCMVGILCLLFGSAMCIGCTIDMEKEIGCNENNHCYVDDDGNPSCEVGYKPQDPDDADNFRCVDQTLQDLLEMYPTQTAFWLLGELLGMDGALIGRIFLPDADAHTVTELQFLEESGNATDPQGYPYQDKDVLCSTIYEREFEAVPGFDPKNRMKFTDTVVEDTCYQSVGYKFEWVAVSGGAAPTAGTLLKGWWSITADSPANGPRPAYYWNGGEAHAIMFCPHATGPETACDDIVGYLCYSADLDLSLVTDPALCGE